MKMKHLKTPQELNEATENLNMSDVIGSSFDWDKFAETLRKEHGSSHLIDDGDENISYDYWLMDVTVKDIVDLIKNYR